MAEKYGPKGGIAYWGKFEDKFPEVKETLKKEFGLVDAVGPNKSCIVSEENGRGLWHVHFCGRSQVKNRTLDTISFEYWHYRATKKILKETP